MCEWQSVSVTYTHNLIHGVRKYHTIMTHDTYSSKHLYIFRSLFKDFVQFFQPILFHITAAEGHYIHRYCVLRKQTVPLACGVANYSCMSKVTCWSAWFLLLS